MENFYLSFNSKEDFLALFAPFGVVEEDRHFATAELSLDIIGHLVLDPEANIIDEKFSVNMQCSQQFADSLPEEIFITPRNPRRMWL